MTLVKNRVSLIIRDDWPGVLVVLVAIGLRLYHLSTQPLWLDEIFTVQISRQSLLVLLQDSFREPNPPLYHLLEMLSSGIWNVQSEWGWRWLSALSGILTISGFYLLCRRFTSRIVVALASLAFAVSPFHVYNSQEARSFAVVILLAVWSTILVADILSSKRRLRWWVALAVLSILGIYTSYFYFVIVGVQGLILWFRAPRRAWWIYVAIIVICCVPIYFMLISTIPTTVGKRASLAPLTPLAILQSLGGEPVRFGVYWQHWLLMGTVGGTALLGAFSSIRNKNTRLLGLYFSFQIAIPLLLLMVLNLALGIRLPAFETRQFLILLPAIFSLFALGLEFLFNHVWKVIPGLVFASILVASFVGLQAYWRMIKSPESAMVLTIRPELKPTDSVVSLDYYTAAASYFYLPGRHVLNFLREKNGIYQFTENLLLFPIIPSETIPVADVTIQDIRNSPRFWVLNRADTNTNVLAALTGGCTQVKSIAVSRFTATLWGNCQP
jgi:4-amino-4-deoxy-L-arabinose transferase-like glycosyltransferase